MLLSLCSLGLLGAGGVAVVASTTQRHGGAVSLGTWSYRSSGYALASSTADMYGATSRLARAAVAARDDPGPGYPASGAGPVFAGIAPASAAGRYLAGTRYDTVRGLRHHQAMYTTHSGGGVPASPACPGRYLDRTGDRGWYPDLAVAGQGRKLDGGRDER